MSGLFVSEIKRLLNLVFYLLSRVAGESILIQEGEINTRLIKPLNGMTVYVDHKMPS
jgi:hypothetical protein